MLSGKQKIILWLALIVIYIATWAIQSHIILASDVYWQLQLARSVLHGGNYIHNFFETTPPLCFLILMPEILIEKIFPMSHFTGLTLYVFLCVALSLQLCYMLIKKFFQDKKNYNNNNIIVATIIALAFAFLILPLNGFGQREHFILMFCMPYFFLVACRIENKKVHSVLSLAVGILAAIGFSIKPFFLLSWILVECYSTYRQLQQKKYRMYPETISVIAFLPIYLLMIYIFFKPYLLTVVPITLRFYYQSINTPLMALLIATPVLFVYICFIFYGATYKNNTEKTLSAILILATLGNLIAFLAQKASWYYHFLPAFSTAWVAAVLLLYIYIHNHRDWVLSLAVGIAVFYIPFYSSIIFCTNLIFTKKDTHSLVCFLHKTEYHREVYFLSATTPYLYSLISYAGAYHRSHFEFLLWMRNYENKNFMLHRTIQQKKDENYLISLLVHDIHQHRPDLIFVDRFRIHYLHFLLKNNAFRSEWKKYHFLLSLKEKNMYEFNVYKRDEESPRVFPIAPPSCKVFSACNVESHSTAFCSHKMITVEPN